MKKQYRIVERHWPYYNLILYHDGVEIAARDSDQMMIGVDIDKLEEEGYTYGYTDEEIEKARKKYERMLENRIGPEAETYEGEWIPRRWETEHDWGIINHRSITCSVCSKEFYNDEPTPHCPNCGAKMKGAK